MPGTLVKPEWISFLFPSSGVQEEQELVQDDEKVDGGNDDEGPLDPFKSAVKAQEDQGGGDDAKFPDPKSVSVDIHHRSNNGV